MSSFLFALGAWAFASRRLVLVAWLLILSVAGGMALLVGTGTDDTYEFPGTESQDALDSLARTFPQFAGTSAQLIAVAPPGGDVTSPEFEEAVNNAISSLETVDQVSSVSSPYDTGSGGDSSSSGDSSSNSDSSSDDDSSSNPNIAPDRSAVLVAIQLSVGVGQVLPSTSEALQSEGQALQSDLPDGSEVAVGGQLFSQVDAAVGLSELASLGIALVVLLITFGSLAAAGMPLSTAIVGVGVSVGIVLTGTRFVTITSTAPLLAVMLGLAVGIDYSLFIISRHRDQLREGMSPEDSVPRAVATAGSAVVFAAATVIIALLGLSLTRVPFLTITGVSAALTVALAALVSLTLTPALLGFAGVKVLRLRERRAVRKREQGSDESAGETSENKPGDPASGTDEPRDANHRGFFLRWVHVVTRVPLATVVIVIALLVIVALPARNLRLVLPDAGSLPAEAPGHVAFDLISKHFGPGYNGPLLVTGSVIQSTDPVDLVQDLANDIAETPGVALIPVATPNQSGDTAVIQVIPEGAPDSEQTADLVRSLRSEQARYLEDYAVELSVTGYTALGIDISTRLTNAVIPFGVLVVGLSLVLLMMVFRSVVVPITAALGYALSIGAALGLISRVFMDGWLAGPLDVTQLGVVTSFAPIILMGVLFGLAMDYEVFLVSRMKEDYARKGEPREAVERGFNASARVITPAAIIMIAVFATFIRGGGAAIQPIAFGLAVGVAIDAFIVRMVFIPAVLTLFGHNSWWLPEWLDRVLPHVDIEGEGLAQEDQLVDWPRPDANVAIALEGVHAKGMDRDAAGLDAEIETGSALAVVGGSRHDRTAVLLALTGRLPVAAGRCKVAGLVLPPRASSLRARTDVVILDRIQDPIESLQEAIVDRPVVLAIDGFETLTDADTRTQILRLITEAHSVDPVTIILAGSTPESISDFVPPGANLHTIDLDTTAPTTDAVRAG